MVTIYTKNYCPYCKRAKELLDSLGVNYTEHDIANNPQRIDTIFPFSGSKTVPQIYAGTPSAETYVGGCDDIYALHDKWELLDKLKPKK